MAKFRLNSNSVFTIGANTIACVTGVTLDEVTDDFISNCMENTSKQHVYGLVDISGTIDYEIDTDGNTELGYVAPGTTGAMVFQPNGTTSGDLDIDSTNITILTRNIVTSSTGLTTGSSNFVADDLTIGANV